MPELRKDPLMGRWVIISTERAKRPDEFLCATPASSEPQPDCPFCEGHESQTPSEIMAIRKPGSAPNSPGWSVRVIPSISPVLRIEGKLEHRPKGPYDVATGIGAHELILETPAHLSSFADLSAEEIGQAVDVYITRMLDLEKDSRFKYVLHFRNSGALAGGSKYRHTYSQLIALPVNPIRVKDELHGAKQYFDMKERCIFCDIVRHELETGKRIAFETASFVALCPFASRFPFETWVLPKRHAAHFTRMNPQEKKDFAQMTRMILLKLRKVLNDPPYNTILHTAPFARHHPGYWHTVEQDFHWHMEVTPRLTRLAGFEWGTGFYINPTPPEEAAKFLREQEVPLVAYG